MRKYIFLFTPMLLIMGLLISSCSEQTTGPPGGGAKGNIYIISNPFGASIFVDGVDRSTVTPDSVTNLSVGNHTVRLELDDYLDTTFTITVVEGQTSSPPTVQLRSGLMTETFGPVILWETTGTTVLQPSGLDLSSGLAYGISGSDVDSVDIYYSSTGFVIRSSEGVNSRETAFFIGNGTDLDDGVDSPLALPSWEISIKDTVTRYVFLFDLDLHYSKFKIVNRGGGTPGNPAWVEVEWIYNRTTNDTNFL